MSSSAIVPLPAITSRSMNACTKRPLIPSKRCVRKTSNQEATEVFTAVAPRRAIASSLSRGAVSGTTTEHGTPSRRAFQATPCAMLPALAVQTPAANSSGGMRPIAFAEPRILNEPIGCRFSSLSQISGPSSTPRRTSGERSAAA